jgi:MFS family permease
MTGAMFSAVSGAHRPAVLMVLGVTQIFAWGSSYYLPAVLAEPIVRDTQWPLTDVVGGLSLGLLVAAVMSPKVGTMIERRGGREVLALSATALGLGQTGLALAPDIVAYILAWMVIGVGMGAGLYDAAFAALGRLYGREARASITMLTLFGGFASTVCWPLSAFLVAELGWRGACLVYAAFQLGFALPLYLLVIPRTASLPPHDDMSANIAVPAARPSVALLIMLAMALTLAASISALMSAHLLTVLRAGGVALSTAVGFGALVGPAQVAARIIEMAIAKYHHPIWTKIASVSFVAIGMAALWAHTPLIPAALAFYGVGIGLESIARGTLPLALFGARGYATLMGRLAMPSLLAQAAAPSIGALLLERVGANGMLAAVTAVAILNVLLGVALLAIVARHRRIQPSIA